MNPGFVRLFARPGPSRLLFLVYACVIESAIPLPSASLPGSTTTAEGHLTRANRRLFLHT